MAVSQIVPPSPSGRKNVTGTGRRPVGLYTNGTKAILGNDAFMVTLLLQLNSA